MSTQRANIGRRLCRWDGVHLAGRRRHLVANDSPGGRAGLEPRAAPDGEVGFSGEADGRIRLWRTTNGRTLHEVHGHQGAVYSLICAPSGEDGAIRIWQARNGARLGQVAGHSGWIYDLAIAPQAPNRREVGRDHTVRLWTTAP